MAEIKYLYVNTTTGKTVWIRLTYMIITLEAHLMRVIKIMPKVKKYVVYKNLITVNVKVC